MAEMKATEGISEVVAAPGAGSFYDRLAQASAEVGHIEKMGRNKEQAYDYVRAIDISAKAVKMLAKYHIAFTATTENVEFIESTTKSGNRKTICRVKMGYLFRDGLSDNHFTCTFFGEGHDSGDKAIYKAMTGALKYCLIQNLLIPTGDDPEEDSADVKETARQAPRGEKAASNQQGSAEKAATGASAPASAEKKADPGVTPEVIASRAEEVSKLCAETDTPFDRISHHYGVKGIEDIVANQTMYEGALKILKIKAEKQAKAPKDAPKDAPKEEAPKEEPKTEAREPGAEG